jgi:hypothetical protein
MSATNLIGLWSKSEDLTRSILALIEETKYEFSETGTNEENMNWINTMLSAIESSNEMGEDIIGFVPFYNGPFKISKTDVKENVQENKVFMKTISEYLVKTIESINLLHEKMDDEYILQLNLPIRDYPEDKKNLTISELNDMFKQLKADNKLRRIAWKGHLENLLRMLEDAFNERENVSDSD